MTLTVLMVTNGHPYAARFAGEALALADDLEFEFLLGCDGPDAAALAEELGCDRIVLRSNGCIESILDTAIGACPAGSILRLDDDERCSDEMAAWLAAGVWQEADNWAFPRRNLWPDERSWIVSEPLWPDLQTRLAVKEKSGRRSHIHAGSPFGTGQVAACAIEHHKFVVRDYSERVALVEKYERLQPGAGSEYIAFSLPETLTDLQIATDPVTA